MYKIYNLWESKELPVSVHVCVRNYKGNSKDIEAQMALDLIIQAKYQHGFIVGFIIADDDSLMKPPLKHSYKHMTATIP
eukprot:15334192-Ditylum_brightwellii.AAC.1